MTMMTKRATTKRNSVLAPCCGLLYIRRMKQQGEQNRTRGVHYYDMGTTDGLAACGYAPTSPNDPNLTYAISGASCRGCRKAINNYIDELATVTSTSVPNRVKEERSGVCHGQ
jgi:hypothetical protein